MKIHFLLLALVAFVALSQHNVDARLHDGFDDLRRLGWQDRCRFDKDCGWSMVQYCDIDGFCKDVCTPDGCRCDGGKCDRRRMTEHRLLRRMTERNSLDELLQRRMEALEEMEGEQDSLQDRFDESRRLGDFDVLCRDGRGWCGGKCHKNRRSFVDCKKIELEKINWRL